MPSKSKYELDRLDPKDPTSRFYIFWSENRRSKRRSTGTANLAEAEKFLAIFTLMDKGEAAKTATIGELWNVYRAKHKVTADQTRKWSWKNLSVCFERLRAADITESVVEDYVEKRQTGKLGRAAKPPTVRRELSALRACLNWCAHPKRKLLDPADVPSFDLPEPSKARDRWLRHDEIQRLLTTAAKSRRKNGKLTRGERFLWIALETAARKQAIMDLTWDRVDFETNVIHFNDPTREETKKKRASVPISKALLPVLKRAYEERTSDLVMTNKAEIWATIQFIVRKIEAEDAKKRGEEPNPDTIKRGMKPPATGISPHVLRHTAATNMARRGVPLWIIAKVLGNTLAMVEKVYAKHSPEDLREAVDKISQGELEPAE